jgi:putative flippase GtrA
MKLSHQLKRFILTGTINSGFAYFVYAVCDRFLHLGYIWAVIVSWCLGVCFSYMMFRTFVFTEGDRSWKSFQRFIPTYVFLLIVNIIGMHILVDIAHWNSLIAQAVVIPGCAVLSFIFNRIFVFK